MHASFYSKDFSWRWNFHGNYILDNSWSFLYYEWTSFTIGHVLIILETNGLVIDMILGAIYIV